MRIEEITLLFGAGGHAKVVLDALQALTGDLSKLIVVDENPQLAGQSFFGCVVVGMEACEEMSGFRFHVAIGHNEIRRVVSEKLLCRGAMAVTIIHPQALVSPKAQLGAGVFLAAGCILAPSCLVEEGTIINHAAVVDHDCKVGGYSHIAPHVTLGGCVKIGARVLVGAAATVLPGVSIGEGATIGAGAVVIDDVPAFSTVVGVPGRILRKENRP